mmetsp:Transcript_64671/g.173287  ORF Transcript_64671/g.173287 Transcript_64671/m.173287 type:complete len:281 (-) Transcript_64671:1236-2078(-)
MNTSVSDACGASFITFLSIHLFIGDYVVLLFFAHLLVSLFLKRGRKLCCLTYSGCFFFSLYLALLCLDCTYIVRVNSLKLCVDALRASDGGSSSLVNSVVILTFFDCLFCLTSCIFWPKLIHSSGVVRSRSSSGNSSCFELWSKCLRNCFFGWNRQSDPSGPSSARPTSILRPTQSRQNPPVIAGAIAASTSSVGRISSVSSSIISVPSTAAIDSAFIMQCAMERALRMRQDGDWTVCPITLVELRDPVITRFVCSSVECLTCACSTLTAFFSVQIRTHL